MSIARALGRAAVDAYGPTPRPVLRPPRLRHLLRVRRRLHGLRRSRVPTLAAMTGDHRSARAHPRHPLRPSGPFRPCRMPTFPAAPTQAVVLAGGQGSRLRPYTDDRPKPMVEIPGTGTADHRPSAGLAGRGGRDGRRRLLRSSRRGAPGVAGRGADLPLRVTTVVETEPLGRGGGLKYAAAHLPHPDQPWYATNGDIWTRFSLRDMAAFHAERDAVATLALARPRIPWGAVETDDFGHVTDFIESPPSPYRDQRGRVRLLPRVRRAAPGPRATTNAPRSPAWPASAAWRASRCRRAPTGGPSTPRRTSPRPRRSWRRWAVEAAAEPPGVRPRVAPTVVRVTHAQCRVPRTAGPAPITGAAAPLRGLSAHPPHQPVRLLAPPSRPPHAAADAGPAPTRRARRRSVPPARPAEEPADQPGLPAGSSRRSTRGPELARAPSGRRGLAAACCAGPAARRRCPGSRLGCPASGALPLSRWPPRWSPRRRPSAAWLGGGGRGRRRLGRLRRGAARGAAASPDSCGSGEPGR